MVEGYYLEALELASRLTKYILDSVWCYTILKTQAIISPRTIISILSSVLFNNYENFLKETYLCNIFR